MILFDFFLLVLIISALNLSWWWLPFGAAIIIAEMVYKWFTSDEPHWAADFADWDMLLHCDWPQETDLPGHAACAIQSAICLADACFDVQDPPTPQLIEDCRTYLTKALEIFQKENPTWDKSPLKR